MEEDASREKFPRQTEDAHEPQRSPALSQDPRGKAQMSLTDQEAEREESDLQLALHLSRVEAQRVRKGEKAQLSLTDQEAERAESDLQLALHRSQQSEAAERTRSLTAGQTTTRVDGATTRRPPPAWPPRHHPGLGAHQLYLRICINL